ncbi:hypothetical protein TeGR_g14937 [Tetraparma gracilis]|uniref:Pseudouridine synthase RsuA/RluA-like domain-containing protein n=1 Tax=Tetraparma gracilis TaxID=2962635 RepID=A0ABQ6M6Y2_9STRA|nr:hypothetical protein TeGR_g14937 [Tetraparma gracilis]
MPASDPALYKECKTIVTPFYYDAASDTTCVIAEPKTGRTHQIRLHCEYLKAPIANDPNYSGGAAPPTSAAAPSDDDDNDFMNPCSQAEWDQMMDARCFQCDRKKGECECSVLTFEGDAEKLDEFVRSTCVFCLRKTSDRALKEYKKRSAGIFLHAVKYCWAGEEFVTGVDVVDDFPVWVGGDVPDGELVRIE